MFKKTINCDNECVSYSNLPVFIKIDFFFLWIITAHKKKSSLIITKKIYIIYIITKLPVPYYYRKIINSNS